MEYAIQKEGALMAIRPPMLQSGDTIGIVTLGSPLAGEIINARINDLKSAGFNVILGQNVYSYNGFLAVQINSGLLI